jgi:hypothetical protein
MLVAFLFATIETVVCIVSYSIAASILGQLGQMGITFIAAVFSLASIVTFMGPCYESISNETEYDLDWGAGSILAIIGMLLMWVAVFAHVFGAVYAERQPEQPGGYTQPVVGGGTSTLRASQV